MIDPATGVETETWGYKLVDGSDGIVGTPGPIIRARVGDILRFTITNPSANHNPHNVDFHAVTGQGGGAEATTVAPGETKTIEARLLYPGFFMYHCAYGDIPAHLPRDVRRDTGGPRDPAARSGARVVHGPVRVLHSEPETRRGAFDRAAVTNEAPSFVVFNGAVGALTGDNAPQMAVGERSPILHQRRAQPHLQPPDRSHWDKVYPEAALLNARCAVADDVGPSGWWDGGRADRAGPFDDRPGGSRPGAGDRQGRRRSDRSAAQPTRRSSRCDRGRGGCHRGSAR